MKDVMKMQSKDKEIRKIMKFYARWTSKVEIVHNGQLQTYYFPRYPHCKFIETEAKDDFNNIVDRSTARTKCQGLVRKSEWLDAALKIEYIANKKLPIMSLFFRHMSLWIIMLFVLIFLINILLTVGLQDGTNENIIERSIQIGDFTSDESLRLVQVLGYIMIFIFIWIASKEFFVALYENIAHHRIFIEKSQRKVESKDGFVTLKDMNIVRKIVHYSYEYGFKTFINARVMYHLILLIFLIYNLIQDTVVGYPVFITYIIYKSETLRDVLRSIVEPYKQIAMTMTLYFALAWGFAVCIFFWLNSEYNEIVQDGCEHLWTCFLTTFDQGYKTGAGPGAAISNPYSARTDDTVNMEVDRYIFDYIVYFVLVVLVFSILTGIIIDKFSELRERANSLENDNRSICFICDQTAADLDKKIGYGGFNNHTFFDHNKWDYVFFLSYLRDKKSQRMVSMTESERIVYEKYITDDNSWLPCEWDYNRKDIDRIENIQKNMMALDEKVQKLVEAQDDQA